MKELQPHIKDETEVHAQKQEERGGQYIGSLEKHNGHIMWELNLKTQEILPVTYSEEYAGINGGITRKIIKKELHWYHTALNEKNAKKHFNNMAKEVLTHLNIPT